VTITVILTPGEQSVAKAIATLRHNSNRAAGTTDARRDNKQHPIELDALGFVAEIAWGKYWDHCPDLTINPRSGGSDFVTRCGKKVDIKATDRPAGRLLAVTGKRKTDADIYVLAIVSGLTVMFVGWASADELLSDSTIIDLGRGPTHALSQDRLHPFAPELTSPEFAPHKPPDRNSR